MGSAPTGADSLATGASAHLTSAVALMGKTQRARLALILPPLLTPELCFGGSASIPTDVRAVGGNGALWSNADTLTALHQRSYNERGRASVEKQRVRLALVLRPLAVPRLCSGCSANLPRDVRAVGESAVLSLSSILLRCTLRRTAHRLMIWSIVVTVHFWQCSEP